MKLPDDKDEREFKIERYVKDSYRFTQNPLRDEVTLWIAWCLFILGFIVMSSHIIAGLVSQ